MSYMNRQESKWTYQIWEEPKEPVAELLSDSSLKARAEHRRAFYALRKQQAAYGHFVPKNFLDFLGAGDITEVMPGDEVEMNMTVMFSDIRNFTEISENMSSHQTFQFINSYLANMETPIHRHSGVIDKFIGDAIMALFPKSADDGVDAAISMMETLKHYNANRAKAGWDPIHIGVGLNTGLTTLGVIGHSERMETTVIGDCVNVASRMEGLTKIYQTPILISEDVLIAISDANKYCIRFVDRVAVKGRVRPISVYEVFDADDAELADKKLAGLEIFEKAVAYYHLREADQAQNLFEEYLAVIPEDRIAKTYLDRCKRYRERGIWEGIEELHDRLEWRDEFNIGHPEIDAEHQQLLENINNLAKALQDEDMKSVEEVLGFLEDYTVKHFGTELALMKQYQYPFMKEHMEDHARFIKRVGSLKEELISERQDKLYSLFRVNLFLFDWLISHSTRVDKHLATFIAEKEHAA